MAAPLRFAPAQRMPFSSAAMAPSRTPVEVSLPEAGVMAGGVPAMSGRGSAPGGTRRSSSPASDATVSGKLADVVKGMSERVQKLWEAQKARQIWAARWARGEVPPPSGREVIAQLRTGYVTPYKDAKITDARGIVTHVKSSGFILHIPASGDRPSSDIYVYTGNGMRKDDPKDAPPRDGPMQKFEAGMEVKLKRATVSPYKSRDERDRTNFDAPQLYCPLDQIDVVSKGNPLPEPELIGQGGVLPPDRLVGVETETVMKELKTTSMEHPEVPFVPLRDALAWFRERLYKSVVIKDALVVAPSDNRGYFYVVPDNGAGLELTYRGGLLLSEKGECTRKFRVDVAALPQELRHRVKVGDRIPGDLAGVMESSFGRYQLRLTEPFEIKRGDLESEVTTLKGDATHMSVGVANVENLSPKDPEKIRKIAGQIAHNQGGPDVVALQEMQDNSGPADDGVVTADETARMLIAAIKEINPDLEYEYVEIAPADGEDGGMPGGNIRVAYLVNTKRAKINLRGNAGSKTEGDVSLKDGRLTLNHNPVRIGTETDAFARTRKPLLLEVEFNGEKIFLINNHLSSKRGDDNEWGNVQPPVRKSEVIRNQQAGFLGDFIKRMLGLDENAKIIVVGDMNEHGFRPPMRTLEASGVRNIADVLIEAGKYYADRAYDYIFGGNSQDLGPAYATKALVISAFEYVHANSEFPKGNGRSQGAGGRPDEQIPEQVSDHDGAVFLVEVAEKESSAKKGRKGS